MQGTASICYPCWTVPLQSTRPLEPAAALLRLLADTQLHSEAGRLKARCTQPTAGTRLASPCCRVAGRGCQRSLLTIAPPRMGPLAATGLCSIHHLPQPRRRYACVLWGTATMHELFPQLSQHCSSAGPCLDHAAMLHERCCTHQAPRAKCP